MYCSSANAKKWEVELQTLKSNNARLTGALQESTANVEEWKRQLQALKEENTKMKSRVYFPYFSLSFFIFIFSVFQLFSKPASFLAFKEFSFLKLWYFISFKKISYNINAFEKTLYLSMWKALSLFQLSEGILNSNSLW